MLAQTCWHCENQQTAWVFRKRKLKVKELLNHGTWRSKCGAATQMDLKFKCNKCNRDFLTVTVCTREEQQHRVKFDLCNWWYVSSQGKLDKKPDYDTNGKCKDQTFFFNVGLGRCGKMNSATRGPIHSRSLRYSRNSFINFQQHWISTDKNTVHDLLLVNFQSLKRITIKYKPKFWASSHWQFPRICMSPWGQCWKGGCPYPSKLWVLGGFIDKR